jgi:hypothetical protein
MNIRKLYSEIGKGLINGRGKEGKEGGEEYDNDDAEKGKKRKNEKRTVKAMIMKKDENKK